MEKKEHKLIIHGLGITVFSDHDELTINAIARNVNQKMQEISSTTKNTGTSQAAILAALEIESERLTLENNNETLTKAVDKKTDELISLIDGVLV